MGDGTGLVVPMALDSTWSGFVQAEFRARHHYCPSDVHLFSVDVRVSVFELDRGSTLPTMNGNDDQQQTETQQQIFDAAY